LKITYCILFFLCIFTAFGQRTLSGRVIGEDMLIPMGIKVFDKDTIEIGKTDFNGYFQIESQKDFEELIFAGIGYEWTKITVPEKCENLEIILLYSDTYDFMSSNKIDRLRKKKFDEIAELHFQAYNKGLFKTNETCFNQEFKPIKPELDKIAQRTKEQAKENKNDFKNLDIGDSVKIPFGLDTSEKRISTYYSTCQNCTEKDYDYVIKGEIINKYRRKMTLEIKITEMKPYDSLNYNGKILNVGSDFKYEMKYFEVITE
tara:strand:+ start:3459 stop:4238 length:780 start_codon:yes stop_codon:yes gene_type:complete